MLTEWDWWSRSCPEKYEDGACAAKWQTFQSSGGVKLGSLIHWAREDGWRMPSPAVSRNGKARMAGIRIHGLVPPPPFVRLGDLDLEISDIRKMPSGKVIATLGVSRSGSLVDQMQIASAISGRQGAAKLLAVHLNTADRTAIDIALGQLVSLAVNLAQSQPIPDGDSIRDIVARVIAEDFRPRYRTPQGIFSEARGCEVRRQDLIAHTPSRLNAPMPSIPH